MTRRPRQDGKGVWHHVMNRGIARRPLFENRTDTRFFLARLAHAVRRGQIEVHAFSILTTHFHLLVRSPIGELSEALRRIQNDYVRWFNRSRRRDGPLVRGRFVSKPVESIDYRRILVRYIDANAPRAGIAPRAELYPFSSAWHYVRSCGPPWLERRWVEDEVSESLGLSKYDPLRYPGVFADRAREDEFRLVERRLSSSHAGPDPMEELLEAAPARIVAWMRRKARLADGVEVGLPVLTPDAVFELLESRRSLEGDWSIEGRPRWDGWLLASVALSRDLCGATLREVSSRVGRSRQNVSVLYQRHAELVEVDEGYGLRVAALARVALDRGGADGVEL